MKIFVHVLVVIGSLAQAARTTAVEPPITAVAFAPRGDFVVGVSQSGVHVFTWPELKRDRTINVSAKNLHCVRFCPEGDLVAVGGGVPADDGSVEIISWPSCETVNSMNEHADSVLSVEWFDQFTVASASIDREIRLWNRTTQKSQRSFVGHSRSVSALCYLKDGKTLVSAGDDQSLRVWNLKTGQLVRSLNQHTKGVHNLALRPVDRGLPMIASAAADRTIRFWQPTIGRMVRYIWLESEPLNIAWLQNGSQLLAACVDGQIRVVDPEEVKVTQTLQGVASWAYAIAVHPTDETVAVAGGDGQIRRVTLKSKP